MTRPDRQTARNDTTSKRVAVCCLVVLCCSQASFAQTVSVSPADPKRWDVAGSVGWLTGNKSAIAEDWNDWYDTFATTLDVGRYWTPHVKTEAGAVFTTEGAVFGRQEPFVPHEGFPVFIPREHHFRVTALSFSATYQFFENTWVHPFVTAGVQLTEERERAFSHDVPSYRGDFTRVEVPIAPPRQATVFTVRPLATGGAKFYVNEQGFIRTDLGIAWHDGRVAQVTWRAGIGIDF
jgi:hypothetical protein